MSQSALSGKIGITESMMMSFKSFSEFLASLEADPDSLSQWTLNNHEEYKNTVQRWIKCGKPKVSWDEVWGKIVQARYDHHQS